VHVKGAVHVLRFQEPDKPVFPVRNRVSIGCGFIFLGGLRTLFVRTTSKKGLFLKGNKPFPFSSEEMNLGTLLGWYLISIY
jgi:hypothetical protein